MRWKVKASQHGLTLGDFLKDEVNMSRRLVKTLKHKGGKMLINDTEQGVRQKLETEDVITVVFPKEVRAANLVPVPMPLSIHYEDDFFIVMEKPANVAVMPGQNHQGNTIANGLIAHYDKQLLPYTVHVITRLDRDTSGLLLIAKQAFSHSAMRSVEISRRYYALVEGAFPLGSGTINLPIRRHPDSIIERMVANDGKVAITHYQTLRVSNAYSFVDVHLETGRTHQIRVHFSHLNHPLLGDDLYGGNLALTNRQALHCHTLSFTHPFTKQALSFTSEWPLDLPQVDQLFDQ
ncbi:ribosomal large subunit pseudouridine synthase D [Streptohalobacillus salinus]|uniref:Pseudouridine synthase n=1 Tax=Streptohalobacillus salinus TaxID=621096 RepID=A0A2V3WFT0_9BACI|nr:RluA family pseudouridine synthase [Streptohalobacillus salinus]PXW93135.1 ribosomal large subunit pseudouridine synthase D [Streptohalobacillus salinus]